MIQIIKQASDTSWVSYTPTITGVTAANEGTQWRRVGDSLEIRSTFTTSGTSALAFRFTIPSGLVIDATKLASPTANNSHGVLYNLTNVGGFPSAGSGPYVVFSETGIATNELYACKATSGSSFTTTAANSMIGAGERARLEVRGIPIVGWSA